MNSNGRKFISYLEMEICYLLYQHLRGYITEQDFYEMAGNICARSGNSLYLHEVSGGYLIRSSPSSRPEIWHIKRGGYNGGA